MAKLPVNLVRQRGNVLFLILIAVALFAALAYAVTSSNRSGNDSGSTEKVSLAAAEILNYSSSVASAVQRLRLVPGCTEKEISFDGPVSGQVLMASALGDNRIAYENTMSPANKSCRVFDPAGAAVPFQKMSPAAQEQNKVDMGYHNRQSYFFFNANNMIENVGIASEAELLMMLPFVKPEVCKFINAKLDITGSISGNLDTNNNNPFQGNYNNWSFLGVPFAGKQAGCVEISTGNFYFFRVLVPR